MAYDILANSSSSSSASSAEEPSFLESAWGLAAGTVVAGTKDIVDSLGTIGGAIGISSPYEASDTRSVIKEYAGETAAAFYDRNPDLVEGAGLVAGTMLPGTAGIKALRAAQAAKGSLLGRMLALPHSSLAATRTAAKEAMLTGDTIYSAVNANTLKALGAGAAANVLDMAAFEMAAITATFASPVYSDFTAGDYAKSLATNIAFGGAVGTAFSTAKTSYQIATASREAARLTTPVRVMPKVGAEGQQPWVNLKGWLETEAETAASLEQARSLGAAEIAVSNAETARRTAVKSGIITESGRLAPNDLEVATKFSDLILGINAPGSEAIDKIGIIAGAKQLQRGILEDATITGRTIDTVTGKVFDAGMNPGKHIGDYLQAGHELFVHGDTVVVTAGKQVSKFETAGSFLALDDLAAQASWLRASSRKGYELVVDAGDLPMMEKLLDATDALLAKQPANVGGKLLRSEKEVRRALFDEKFRQAELLAGKMLPEQLATRLNVMPEFLNGAEFSNMVARSGDDIASFLRSPRHISVIYDLPTLAAASEHFFTAGRKVSADSVATAISASSFLQGFTAAPRAASVAAIKKKLAAGETMPQPSLTVKKDGTVTFDGNKRITAIKEELQAAGAETDHVPVHVNVEAGAKIPATLPDGSPFPVIRNADGKVVVNPAAQELPIRLTRQYAEENIRVTNLNTKFSEESNLVAAALIPDSMNMPPQELGLSLLDRSSPTGKGPGFVTNSEGVTGGIEAFTQQVGVITSRIRQAVNEVTDRLLNPVLLEPLNDPQFKVIAELAMVRNKFAGTASHYTPARDGSFQLVREDIAINKLLAARKLALMAERDAISQTRALTPEEVKLYNSEIKAASSKIPAPLDAEDAMETIQLSEGAFKVVDTSTSINSKRLAQESRIHATTGRPSTTLAQQYGLERVYFHATNTKKYPHFVFVRKEDGITPSSQTSVVTAASAEALATKVKLLQREFPGMEFIGDPESKVNYSFFYKKDVEAFHKAKGDYEYSRGMNENYIDSALRSKKLMYEPEGTPMNKQLAKEFVDDFTDWHRRMNDKSVRDVVELKYAQFFKQLEIMGEDYTKTGTSTFTGATAGASSFAAQSISNPYGDMIKQALDIGKQLEYPMWLKANEFVSNGFGAASLRVRKAGVAMLEAKNPTDFTAEAARLNAISDKLGFGNPYEAVMLEKYASMLPANPTLSANISKANAMLNFMVLGSDMLQAFNTLIGTTVHATELVALRGAIKRHDIAGAGKLAGLAAEDIPGNVEIVARTAKAFWAGDEVWNVAKGAWEHRTGKEIMQEYIASGLRIGDAKMFADAADSLAYNPKLGASAFSEKVEATMETVRKFTGNTGADAVSRFMAAHSMRILTDKALSKGLLSSEKEAAIYINQHVTRVHGATVASQRPIIFSGPIGQSIGVFMTFYTNFLQRMFQHVGAGDAPALATMAGMQVGLYGLQGLPAFNFINTHLVGTASGNKAHKDMYQAAGGDELAKWIMYGAGSNMLGLVHPDLKVNLYSRGDLNPRQASIIPMPWNPEDTALFSATTKTISNLGKLATHIAGGAPLGQSLAFALEHNGVNRPISGLGAFLGGGQTTSKGTLLSSYGDADLLSFAFLARVAGGKPLDDATAADGLYRLHAYQADRSARIASVGENMRLALKAGNNPDTIGFMRDYVHAGGDTDNFNKFMKRQFTTANNSQINKAAEDMNSPEAEGLSRLMGGEFREDVQHPQQQQSLLGE